MKFLMTVIKIADASVCIQNICKYLLRKKHMLILNDLKNCFTKEKITLFRVYHYFF